MTHELASKLIGETVSWHSSQNKYFIPPRQVRKLGEDLSLSDYQEVAKTHTDQRRHEEFKAIAQWMEKQGAKEETRLSAVM